MWHVSFCFKVRSFQKLTGGDKIVDIWLIEHQFCGICGVAIRINNSIMI